MSSAARSEHLHGELLRLNARAAVDRPKLREELRLGLELVFLPSSVVIRGLVDDDLEVAAAAAHDARHLRVRERLELREVLGEQSLRRLERLRLLRTMG